MNESEFRDWLRQQLRSLEDRLGRLEKAPPPAWPPRPSQQVKGDIEELANGLLAAVKGGNVTGVAIAFLGPNGPRTGWAIEGPERMALLGVATTLVDELLYPSRLPAEETKAA